MAEHADIRVIAEIGQQYVAISDQFLTEQLGRQYNVQELAQFAETAVGTLLASAYTNFREALGKEAAEAWLKKTLGLSTANIRLMGADALVKFDVEIKDMPNTLHKQRQAMQVHEHEKEPPAQAQAPAPPPTPEKCTCRLTDGACFTCTRILSSVYKGTFQFMRQMSESVKKTEEMCQVCRVNQTDRALAVIIPDALSIKVPDEQKTALHQEIRVILHQLASSNGAREIPLTEQALKEATSGEI